MSAVFILGAGFSKALSCHMPTTKELSNYIQTKIEGLQIAEQDQKLYKKLVSTSDGVENLLSYLFEMMPWKSPAESYRDKAALIELQNIIAEYIIDSEERAFKYEDKIPSWSKYFTKHLLDEKPTVATLNYDTMLERLSAHYHERPEEYVGLPVISTTHRRPGSVWSTVPAHTYALLKLHGSINFYFHGDENTPSQQVYFREVRPTTSFRQEKQHQGISDLIPLIVPPLSTKSAFYNIDLVRTMWRRLRERIKEADEIYCVGYSLPKTDLSMRLFLSASADYNDKTIYIVNSAKDEEKRKLLKNYSEAFGKNCQELQDNYVDSVKLMVSNLV